MGRILEGGHYYLANGPTMWSVIGWGILEKIRQPEDKTLLFIDDVHPGSAAVSEERCLPTVEFKPHVDFMVMESDVRLEATTALVALQQLPKREKARKNGNGKWFASGFPLTDDGGFPLCVLLDAGLTLRKRSLGFREGVNILPFFYEDEQKKLFRIIAKLIPDFHLKAVLFDLSGNFRSIKSD